MGRTSAVNLAYDYAVSFYPDERAYAAVFTHGHEFEVIVLVLWYVGGVGVQFLKHSVNACGHDFFHRDGVHIVYI